MDQPWINLGRQRVQTQRLSIPSLESGAQEIKDFLGVALQVQQHEVLFVTLKRTTDKR
jgi:hypothetical protein